MPKPKTKHRFRKTRLLLGVILLALLGLAAYGVFLAAQIEMRFAGRLWSIPSRVYSDTTVLFPGQALDRRRLGAKFKRLGYREVSAAPGRKGEWRDGKAAMDVFLRDLALPGRSRPGFPLRIRFNGGEIARLTRLDQREDIGLLEVDPEELAVFFGPEREERRLIAIAQVPRHVVLAVLAAEDARFYEHPGLDPRGILRALIANLRAGAIREGGSTLTQQLVKNYFLTPERTLARKIKEGLMALCMEIMYSKDQILEMYLNEIYLGQKGSVAVNGLGEAAAFYFNKDVSDLSVAEGAAVAGLIRAPNRYSPYVDPERCQARRNDVLAAMQQRGWLGAEELKAALASPLRVSGFERYGRRAPYFIDYLRAQLPEFYSAEVLGRLGLAIHTTLDPEVQAAAETALAEGLTRLEKTLPALRRSDPVQALQGAVVVLQPRTGHVLALVGGRDYETSQFNRMTQARRQPGSIFKPFVYVAGLERFTPVARLSNLPRDYRQGQEVWRPDNFEPVPEETVTLRQALARSINRPTVDLALQIGLERIVETAKRFGFSTPLEPYPSLALGAFEVIPLETARAYCPFAADGVLPHPLSLKEVVDDQGQVRERRSVDVHSVISPAEAFLMSSLLRSVTEEGTARSLKNRGIRFPAAGKTGTTNDGRDAWFVGYTPDFLALVWVGFDNGDPLHATGATAALPIWAALARAMPQHTSGGWFRTPPGVVELRVCRASGELAVPGACPDTLQELFLEANAPSRPCPQHKPPNLLERMWQDVEDFLKKFPPLGGGSDRVPGH